MNKDLLKHLPFNLFWCASSFITPFLILPYMLQIDIIDCIMISLFIYLLDVKWQTHVDYLSEKIKKLESNIGK